MDNSEKLDKILEKLIIMENRMENLENSSSVLQEEVKSLNRKMTKMHGELKGMDDVIFDEAERVHEILMEHAKDGNKHLA